VGTELSNITPWIPAQVPGSIYQDLYNANLIENPYFEMNSLKCEWVENKWWIYKTSLDIPKQQHNKRLELVFEGID